MGLLFPTAYCTHPHFGGMHGVCVLTIMQFWTLNSHNFAVEVILKLLTFKFELTELENLLKIE